VVNRASEKINVTVRWPGGARWGKFPFWMTDAMIIRDTRDELGWLSPKPEQITVIREPADD